MKRLAFICLLLVLVCLISACEVDLEVPLPDHDPKLAVFGYWRAGEPLDVYVYHSRGININDDPQNFLVPDAEVILYKDGAVFDTLDFINSPILDTVGTRVINGDTVSVIRPYEGAKYSPAPLLPLPKAGEYYTVKVSHTSYPEASAGVIIQPKPVINDYTLIPDSITFRDQQGGAARTWGVFTVNLLDQQPEQNYYLFFAESEFRRTMNFGGQTSIDTIVERRWAHTSIKRSIEGIYYGETLPLSDSTFEGQSGDLSCYLYLPKEREVLFAPHPDSVTTALLTPTRIRIFTFLLSDEYGAYHSAIRLQSSSRLRGIEQAFFNSEAVFLPSNVAGGYGVIGSLNFCESYILF